MSFFTAADTGPVFLGPGDMYTFLASGADTDGAYFVMEGMVPPEGGPPPHIHHKQAESFYVVEGELEIRLGDQVYQAKAGDFVHISKGTPHAFKNQSQTAAKMILTFVPAGEAEQFFKEAFEPATDRNAPPPPLTDAFVQNLLKTAERYDIEFLPPPERT